jgi:hypothetical protein
MLPVEVAFISYDPRAQLAIVFLREQTVNENADAPSGSETTPRRLLPIWIGIAEAHAIYSKIENKTPLRPMTHDLLATLIETFGARVRAVVVHSYEEYVFHGRIELTVDGKQLDIDSRPSDAIALALRANAPIYVEEAVMNESAISENDIRDMDKHALKYTLEALDEESYDEFKV